MTTEQAQQFGWNIAGELLGFVGIVAVILLALALMREISR